MKNQRGSGRIGVFIWLVLIVAGIFVATRTIPKRINVLSFHDYCEEQTRFAAASRNYTENQLRKDVLGKAKELEIPINPKKIGYLKRKNEIVLTIEHEVTFDVEVYEWSKHYKKKFQHVRF